MTEDEIFAIEQQKEQLQLGKDVVLPELAYDEQDQNIDYKTLVKLPQAHNTDVAGIGTITKYFESLFIYNEETVRRFPRSERKNLVYHIQTTMASIRELVFSVAARVYKKTTLSNLIVKINELLFLVRISLKMKFISMGQYEVYSKHISSLLHTVEQYSIICERHGRRTPPAQLLN